MAEEFRDDRRCFVCGENNPAGLKLKLRTDAERGESASEVTFPAQFQGWAGIVHGGLLATVLDEALIYAAGARGFKCVTGEVTVRYVKAASTGVPYALKGRFVEDKGRASFSPRAFSATRKAGRSPGPAGSCSRSDCIPLSPPAPFVFWPKNADLGHLLASRMDLSY